MNSDTTPSATGASARPPFLHRNSDGRLWIITALVTLDNIVAAVKALNEDDQASFGKHLLYQLGYSNTNRDGEDIMSELVVSVLTARPVALLDAYIETARLQDQVDWKVELIRRSHARSNPEAR